MSEPITETKWQADSPSICESTGVPGRLPLGALAGSGNLALPHSLLFFTHSQDPYLDDNQITGLNSSERKEKTKNKTQKTPQY